jgi:hypothetical protein
MAGLYLGRTTGQSFTATAASPPSASGTTATQQAYGTAAGGGGPTTARNGTIIAGLAGAGLLLFLWYTLPR